MIILEGAYVLANDPARSEYATGQPPLELLLVYGNPVVEQSQLLTVDPIALAKEVDAASKTLLARAEGTR
jgi:hypothetical protein